MFGYFRTQTDGSGWISKRKETALPPTGKPVGFRAKNFMTRFQFDRVFTQMAKEFGRMQMGHEEDMYAYPSLSLEGNAMRVHREYPSSNSRRLREAIALVLFDIRDRLSGETADTDAFRNEDNARLEHALLMAFDPQTNDQVRAVLEGTYGAEGMSEEQQHAYYQVIVRCLLRIKDSIDLWEKQLGPDGYFDFVERLMGKMVKGTDMQFSVLTPM